MKTHYEILEIPQTALPEEIKRAYYTAVKKHPPEHNPKEFARIKSAYDMLRDPQKRHYYDSELDLDMFELYSCKEAEALLEKGKSGRAINLYKGLLKRKPRNLILMHGLAEAYQERGFINKAIEQYEKYLDLYEQDMDTWNAYANCLLSNSCFEKVEIAIRKAVDLNNKHKIGNVDIVLQAIVFFIDTDIGFTRFCFDMLHKMDINKSTLDNPVMLIVNIVLKVVALDFVNDALLIGKNVKPQDYGYEKIEKLLLIKDLLALSNSGRFDKVFVVLFETLIDGVVTPNERIELLCVEGHILFKNPSVMRRQIRMINSDYPRLYALHKKFFQSFLNEKNEEKMYSDNVSQTRKLLKTNPELMDTYGGSDDFDSEYDENDENDENIIELESVRTGPKIGRNDPCPCGSGKKYKKCCGAG
jgi:tetratricopeptide (TPR) repeat protein